MPARMVSLDNGAEFVFDKPILLIGREEGCDVVLDSRKISRHHCCIAELDEYLLVRDLGSTNGIMVNGSKKSESRLNDGDELTIGNLRFKVAWNGKKQTRAGIESVKAPAQRAGNEPESLRLPMPGE